MKLHSCFWILSVVALFSVSKGQDQTTEQNWTQNSLQDNYTTESFNTAFLNESKSGYDLNLTSTESPILNNTSGNRTAITDDGLHKDDDDSSGEDQEETGGNTTTASEKTTELVTAATGTSLAPTETAGTKTSSSWGYVFLVLIILLIIALCVILFFLRRVSRTYTFDLQRPGPSRLNEPIGTFEPVYLDDLDHQIDTIGLSTAPAGNGTTILTEENGPNGEVSQDEPHTNGLQTTMSTDPSPTSQTEPDKDQSDQFTSPDLFLDSAGEEQLNGNNNNPSICSSDPFVEINLEEPQWQLFTSPQTPSSVLPFSPFSSSSSS